MSVVHEGARQSVREFCTTFTTFREKPLEIFPLILDF